MRALFIGGTIDNSEVDIEGEPPVHYPENTGAGRPRYRLFEVGRREGAFAYAVYAAPEMNAETVQSVTNERDYARRFSADEIVKH